MKITFTKDRDLTNEFDTTKVVLEVETESKQEVINAFIEFLAGSGFSVEDLKEEWYN